MDNSLWKITGLNIAPVWLFITPVLIMLNPLDYTSFNNNYEISYIGTYTQDILDILFPENTMQINDKSRYYYLKTGDFIAIEVRIKNKTLAQAMKAMFSMTTNDFPIIYVRAGGMIRDEAN